jgi:hypothetical protein
MVTPEDRPFVRSTAITLGELDGRYFSIPDRSEDVLEHDGAEP